MTTGRVDHATVVVERTYDVILTRAFHAWGALDAHRSWHVPGEGWVIVEAERDFVVGGRDFCLFGPRGEPIYRSDGRFEVIVPNCRVVSVGTMFCRDRPISTTLCTVEFRAHSRGTKLILTDQSAYLDALHDPVTREAGWQVILANLAAALTGEAPRAN